MGYFNHDDIAQIGSPPGRGLVGIIRVSGPDAFVTAGRTLSDGDGERLRRHGVRDCRMMLPLRRRVGPTERESLRLPCPVRVFSMPGPASYTREDVVEFHLPGSPAILGAAMKALTEAGARPALPGEFTFRAFRNGRLSLSQAEAVEETIRAADAAERRSALARLGDPSPGRIGEWRDRVMAAAAMLEASLDFDAEELGEDPTSQLGQLVEELSREGVLVADRDRAGLSFLPHLALVGRTNAGKSSLFNALLGEDEVLVSAEASTTRDSLRREVVWHGVGLVLSDNPGHDATASGGAGEAAGLSMRRLGGEDLACLVLDGSRGLDEEDLAFIAKLEGRVLAVRNKCDLPAAAAADEIAAALREAGLALPTVWEVSARTGEGLEELRRGLAEACRGVPAAHGWNRRQRLELGSALECCRRALAELSGPGRLELAAEDLRGALSAFGRAMGEGYAEEALELIFSRFCLGK